LSEDRHSRAEPVDLIKDPDERRAVKLKTAFGSSM